VGARFPGRRWAGENWEWVFPLSAAAEVDAALAGAPEVGAAEMELLRIRAGLARVPGDIGPADLPNEGGLDQVAISYSKGCYLGQEVMARVKAMGRIRRTLVRVGGHFAAPPVPAALWRGATRAGELRSVVAVGEGSEGLALISVDAAAAQEPLALVSGGPPVVTLHTR
jgi:folate-binding protein YgfZ